MAFPILAAVGIAAGHGVRFLAQRAGTAAAARGGAWLTARGGWKGLAKGALAGGLKLGAKAGAKGLMAFGGLAVGAGAAVLSAAASNPTGLLGAIAAVAAGAVSASQAYGMGTPSLGLRKTVKGAQALPS